MQRSLYHLEDSLFGYGTREDDREVCERRNSFAYSTLVRLDILVRLALYQIPFVDAHYQTLLVLLDQRIDIEVLCLNTARRVDHEDTHVAVLDRADGTNDRVILLVFRHFGFLTDSRCIYQIKILAELVIARVNGVARSAWDIGHDRTILTDERIENT